MAKTRSNPPEELVGVRVGMTLDKAVGLLIRATLQATKGNVSRAAAILGIDRSTLYEKIKRYAPAIKPRSCSTCTRGRVLRFGESKHYRRSMEPRIRLSASCGTVCITPCKLHDRLYWEHVTEHDCRNPIVIRVVAPRGT